MDLLDIAIVKKLIGGGGGSGTDNYNDLSNLPKINDTTLSGNKTSANLGLQSEINSDSKLASDLVDDTNQDNKFVTSSEKSTWNGKQNAIDADHKINADYVDDSTSTNKFVTATDKETWNAKQNAIDSSHKLSSDLVDDTNHTNKFVTSTEKQTWNGKQNAIDSDHKLSSSLVSFTTAEAAALASGIDSTKVGQISTNQTNILYGLEHGSKNQLNFDGFELHGTGITWKLNDDKTITATGTATSLSYIVFQLNNADVYVDELCDGLHYLSGCPSGGNFDTKYSLYASKGNYTSVDTGTGVLLPSTSETDVRIVIKIASGFAIPSGGITFKPMICLKSVYDVYPEYQSYGAPNYDLTRLEAEDRAALAEEIDAGAKNKFNPANIVELRNLATNGSDYAYVSTVTDTRTQCNFCVFSWNGNTKIDQLTKVDVTANGKIALIFTKTANYNKISFGHSGQSKDLMIFYNVSDLVNGQTYVLSTNVTQFNPSVTNFAFSDVMLCTKAAFGVSNKFVPYRPNYDLVCQRSGAITKRNVTGTDWTLTDVSLTGSSGFVYFLSAGVDASGNYPTGILISTSNNSSDFMDASKLVCKNDDTRTTRMFSCSAIDMPYQSTTYYVWSKSTVSATNAVTLMWHKEPR